MEVILLRRASFKVMFTYGHFVFNNSCALLETIACNKTNKFLNPIKTNKTQIEAIWFALCGTTAFF